jgi:hypothetical protein
MIPAANSREYKPELVWEQSRIMTAGTGCQNSGGNGVKQDAAGSPCIPPGNYIAINRARRQPILKCEVDQAQINQTANS